MQKEVEFGLVQSVKMLENFELQKRVSVARGLAVEALEEEVLPKRCVKGTAKKERAEVLQAEVKVRSVLMRMSEEVARMRAEVEKESESCESAIAEER